jgi:uncharacterized membrane protein YozB (DUF420 family)
LSKAPLASTIVAIALIPVALLFIHAFISGLKNGKHHRITGLLAVTSDLSVSIGYMIYRSLGGKVGSSVIHLSGGILTYFIVHGIVSLIVIILELTVLATGLYQWQHQTNLIIHRKLAKVLFPLWWVAFLSGELFYVINYIVLNHS